jgi:DNA (cytosine-5)-methyltransferase 1
MTLTVGSLFSGIGGLDLGLERAGMKVIWQSEIDPYCCKILRKHWPEVPNHGNIKEINWQTVERPDVICGGYPCQPFSQAGKRQGENDPRHLWPWVREAICHLRPKYAILENVRGHLNLGFDTVLGQMAAIGYDARWDCIPAAALGAPHLRDRIFIIARPSRSKQCGALANSNDTRSWDALCAGWDAPWHGSEIVADSDRERSEKCLFNNEQVSQLTDRSKSLADNWQTEPNVGRVAHGIPNRVDRLRGLGNAVVPQVAEYIGRLITQLN